MTEFVLGSYRLEVGVAQGAGELGGHPGLVWPLR